MSALPAQALSTGCRLVSVDGRTLPLRSVHLDTDTRGGLARVHLEQTFHNPFPEPLRVSYQLPLPADGAVVNFTFRLGPHRVQGAVQRKADARARFEEAILKGRTAALMEQDRSSVFRQELGNIPPGETVVAEVVVEQPLAWREGAWEWRFPTVVAPRFLGTEDDTPDGDRVSVDVADSPLAPRATCAVTIGDPLTGPPVSPSHPLIVRGSCVELGGASALDRDVVVRWPVAAAEPGVTVETARGDDGDAHALLTVVPPDVDMAGLSVARDLCLLLDTSGSMGGKPLAQLKAFAAALVEGMSERDHLEMIEFSRRPQRWRAASVAVTAKAKAEALAWIHQLQARGGTRMHEAIEAAVAPLRAESQRQVVLVSDGLIGFEQRVIGHIKGALPVSSRVHSVGVGSAVNRSLTGPVARAGGGVEVVVGPDEPVAEAVRLLDSRTRSPQVVDFEIDGEAVMDVAPERLPDLFAGAPVRLALRVRPKGGVVVLRGRTAAGPWRHQLELPPIPDGGGRRVVSTRYARERVADLEAALAAGAPRSSVDPTIERLGLRHQIATRLTSWIAVSQDATVAADAPARVLHVPQELPYAISAEGVGLRAPARRKRRAAVRSYQIMEPMALRSPASAPSARGPGRRRGPPADDARTSSADGFVQDADHERSGEEVDTGSWGAVPPRRPVNFKLRSGPSIDRLLLARDRAETASGEPKPAAEMADDVSSRVGPRGEAVEGASQDASAAGGPGAPPTAPAPGRTKVRARIAYRGAGLLVITWVVERDRRWDPGQVIVWIDGKWRQVQAATGTTRAGALAPGQTVRLVIPLDAGATPPRYVDVGPDLILTLE